MKKIRHIALAAIAVGLIVLAGCGGLAPKQRSASDTDAAVTPTIQAETAEEITVETTLETTTEHKQQQTTQATSAETVGDYATLETRTFDLSSQQARFAYGLACIVAGAACFLVCMLLLVQIPVQPWIMLIVGVGGLVIGLVAGIVILNGGG